MAARADLERGHGRASARFGAEPAHRGPEEVRADHSLEVDLLRSNLEVGCLGRPVEVDGEVIGRMRLAKGDRREKSVDRGDVAVVDAKVR